MNCSSSPAVYVYVNRALGDQPWETAACKATHSDTWDPFHLRFCNFLLQRKHSHRGMDVVGRSGSAITVMHDLIWFLVHWHESSSLCLWTTSTAAYIGSRHQWINRSLARCLERRLVGLLSLKGLMEWER